MDNFRELKVQYLRLERHFSIIFQRYDEVALYDLSHSLRLWVEMEDTVNNYITVNNLQLVFQSGVVSKRTKKILLNKEHIFLTTPDGIKTVAGNGEIFGGDKSLKLPKKFFVNSKAKFFDGDSIQVSSLLYGKDFILEDDGASIIKNGYQNNRYKYSQWLDAEAIRVCYPNSKSQLELMVIPRKMLLKRVANILGGSHKKNIHASKNKFDEPIQYLMNYYSCGVPLPYFIVLNITHNILSKFSSLKQ